MNPKIVSFIEKPIPVYGGGNQWFKDGLLDIYIKVGRMYYNNEIIKIVNLSNMEVRPGRHKNPEANMGKGIFTKFLAEMETLAEQSGYDAIKVESVINQRFVAYLFRQGFVQIPDGASLDFGPSLIKLLGNYQPS